MTDVSPVTSSGHRRHSDETRAKLSAASKAKWDALAPEVQAARKANLVHGPRRAPPPEPPPAPTGGPRNPLDDAPRAHPGDGPAHEGRAHPLGPPPRFSVPDLPPLELGADGAGLEDLAQPTPAELAGFVVDPDTVADMLSLPFDFVADRRGAHWRLRPLERERLAGAIARKVNEHQAAARLLDAGGDWILIVGGLSMILSARLAEDARNARGSSPDTGARPGLAGLRLVPRRPGGGDPAPAAGPDPGPVRVDGPAAGPGFLNGFRTDAVESPGAPAPEAAGRTLSQTF